MVLEQGRKMELEIERKFLVKNDKWRTDAVGAIEMKQGYLNSAVERTVRIRIAGEKGILTIKGRSENLTREEFEYEVPLSDAYRLIELCEKPIIEKTRYLCPSKEVTWEIDEFKGENAGLVIAEIELNSEDQKIEIPEWIGEEVSTDPKYYNASLITNPFMQWKK